MPGIYRRENMHPNKWVNLVDKGDCWVKRRENAHPDKWQTATVYRRQGGGWNQIYPKVATSVSNRTINSGANVGYRNGSNRNWIFDGTARQGSYSSYGTYYGFCDLAGSWFEGSGSIFQLDAASFSGTRNGSGAYSSNQTVYFNRSEQHPKENGGNAYGYTGQFKSTTGGPGSGGRMNQRGLLDWGGSGRSNCMDWMNCVNGKQWLHIGGISSSADYMGMSNISFHASYWFNSTYRVFAAMRPRFAISLFARVDVAPGDELHQMLVYPGEENMSLMDIMERREIMGLSDISEDNTDVYNDMKFDPANGNYFVKNGQFFIEFFNMYEDRALYYSYDNETWSPALFDTAEGKYSMPYNKLHDKVYLRVLNYKTEELLYEQEKDIDVIQVYGTNDNISDFISKEELDKYTKL